MGESKYHTVLVVGSILLPSPSLTLLLHRNGISQAPQPPNKLVKITRQGQVCTDQASNLFPYLYPCKAISSVRLKKNLAGMAAELVFSDEATFHPRGKVNCHHIPCSQMLTSHSVLTGHLKSKRLAPFHLWSGLFFFFRKKIDTI
jgi:hypothetical protein